MNNIDFLSVTTSVASIILAILAIILSILFYCWSKKSNDEIQKASQNLDQTTKNIEKLFDKLYADTFSLMKSNVTAMQNKIFPQNIDSESKTKEEAQKNEIPIEENK